MSGRILFRCDTRHPINDAIFRDGFSSWKPDKVKGNRSAWEKQIYRARTDGTAGDIESSYAVCLSQRIAGAALFPFGKRATEDGWIYAVYVDEKDVFSTHNKQIFDGYLLAQAGNVGEAWWPIFAHEVAVKTVAGKQIIAAIECKRGIPGFFSLIGKTLTVNANCEADKQYKDLVLKLLRDEANLGSQQRATPQSGYHKA